MNEEQMPGWYFAHMQDDLNLHILRMCEGTFSLKAADILQSTLVISNSKGLTEILRDIRTSTYQSWESEENNKLNNHI